MPIEGQDVIDCAAAEYINQRPFDFTWYIYPHVVHLS